MDIKVKDTLFAEALKSAVAQMVGRIDFEHERQKVLKAANQLEAQLGLTFGIFRVFTLQEFSQMKEELVRQIKVNANRDVAQARVAADAAVVKYKRSFDALVGGEGLSIDQGLQRLPAGPVDETVDPLLAKPVDLLKQIDSAVAEQVVGFAKDATLRIADCLRQLFQLELRFIFGSAFIGESEVKALIDHYLAEVPELQMAA